MLEKDTVKSIFDHIRNMFYCTLILAAGFYVNLHPPDWVAGSFLAPITGYGAIGTGILLMLLVFSDGIYKISKLDHPVFLSLLLIAFYLLIMVRLALILLEFRMG